MIYYLVKVDSEKRKAFAASERVDEHLILFSYPVVGQIPNLI